MDCSPPGSSVHGTSQARILEWVAISSSKGSSIPGIEPRLWQFLHCRWILYCLTKSTFLSQPRSSECIGPESLGFVQGKGPAKLSSVGSRKRNRPVGVGRMGWVWAYSHQPGGRVCVCVCVCRCCFSTARVLGSRGAGRRPWRGQEGPAAAHQILSLVALKSRRPWCRKSPGLWKDLGPWSGPAQDGAGP